MNTSADWSLLASVRATANPVCIFIMPHVHVPRVPLVCPECTQLCIMGVLYFWLITGGFEKLVVISLCNWGCQIHSQRLYRSVFIDFYSNIFNVKVQLNFFFISMRTFKGTLLPQRIMKTSSGCQSKSNNSFTVRIIPSNPGSYTFCFLYLYDKPPFHQTLVHYFRFYSY